MPRADELKDQIRRGVDKTGSLHPEVGEAGEAKLTDIDGVGPSTAKALRRAEVESPRELQGKSTRELAAVDGIGPVTAERIKSQVEFGRPGTDKTSKPILRKTDDEHDVRGFAFRQNRKTELTAEGETQTGDTSREVRDFGAQTSVGAHPASVGVEGDDKQQALSDMADRSPEERQTDRMFNAPITLDYEYWAQNKNRVDYPGVDTVPKSVARERALSKVDKAIDEDAVLSFKNTESSGSSFNKATRELELGEGDQRSEEVFAHELGHAIDAKITEPGEDPRSESIFSEEAERQADALVERRRGSSSEDVQRTYDVNPFEGIEEGEFADVDTTYDFNQERFADVFASMTVEPRAAKREAPAAVREVEEELSGTGFLPGSPF